MLMPTLQHIPTNQRNYSMDNFIESMQHQSNYINQLLSTAATGTGVVNDVDALLTPIQSPASRYEQRPERNLWRTDEILQMLEIMQKLNAIELLNDKSVKSDKVFRNIETLMHQSGYRKKSHVQIWTKWKFLKSTYTTSKRNGIVSKMVAPQIFDELHKMLNGVVTPRQSGRNSDCGNSKPSMDGDSSNGGPVISSSPAVNVGIGLTEKPIPNCTDEDNNFGMAHPIFGFRLGLVKQEPIDTGYETATNNGTLSEKDQLEDQNANSSCSSALNNHFHIPIKREPLDYASSPPLLAKLQPEVPFEKAVGGDNRITDRDADMSASTNNSVKSLSRPSTPVHPPSNEQKLPPLRIAPFAKVTNLNTFAPPPSLSLSPPPLTMSGRSKQIHFINAQNAKSMKTNNNGDLNFNNNNNNNNIINWKTTTKVPQLPLPTTAPSLSTPTQKSRSVMVFPKQTSAKSGIKTGKVGRPKRMNKVSGNNHVMYDLSAVKNVSQQMNLFNVEPSTSKGPPDPMPPYVPHQQTLPQVKKRSRRLYLPETDCQPIPNKKMPRLYNMHTHPPPSNYSARSEANDSVCKDIADERSHNQFQLTQIRPTEANDEHSPKQQDFELMSSFILELSNSMRDIQREIMADFFAKQMELMRKEHEFQMKQDMLLMQAFTNHQRRIVSEFTSANNVKQKRKKEKHTKRKWTERTNSQRGSPTVHSNHNGSNLNGRKNCTAVMENQMMENSVVMETESKGQDNHDNEYVNNNGIGKGNHFINEGSECGDNEGVATDSNDADQQNALKDENGEMEMDAADELCDEMGNGADPIEFVSSVLADD